MKKKIKVQATVITVATIMLVITTIFLSGCFDYLSSSRKIASIEKEADRNGYWTKDGWFNGWSNERRQMYDDAVAKKEELVESSDVAQWCYESANTLTGVVVRALAIIIGILLWACSVIMIAIIMLIDVCYLKKTHRAKAR